MFSRMNNPILPDAHFLVEPAGIARGTQGAPRVDMRIVSSSVAVVICLLAAGCAATTDDAGSSQGGGLTEGDRRSAHANFHPQDRCTLPEKSNPWLYADPEIDLSDRNHPRYRLRHTYSAHEIVGKQNINIYLRDGTAWRSDDNLVARRWSIDRREIDAEDMADIRDPWEPLPVPKEFLDKAFEVMPSGKYNLLAWEAVLNRPLHSDFTCRHEFYYGSSGQ